MIAQIRGACQAGTELLVSPLSEALEVADRIEIEGIKSWNHGPMSFAISEAAPRGSTRIRIFPSLCPPAACIFDGWDWATVDSQVANGAVIKRKVFKWPLK